MKLKSTNGRELEEEVLGIAGSSEYPDFRSYGIALEQAMSMQLERGVLSNFPQTIIARKLFNSVRSHLRRNNDRKLLEFYVAIGSAFDVHHGVDMFFKIRGKVVTLDLTRNNYKQRVKADIILTAEMIENDEFDQLGEYIAEIFNI